MKDEEFIHRLKEFEKEDIIEYFSCIIDENRNEIISDMTTMYGEE